VASAVMLNPATKKAALRKAARRFIFSPIS
jgi:hypothetical protein